MLRPINDVHVHDQGQCMPLYRSSSCWHLCRLLRRLSCDAGLSEKALTISKVRHRCTSAQEHYSLMVLVKPFLLSALRYAKPACMSTCWSPVDKVTQTDGGLPTSAQKQQFLMALAQPFLPERAGSAELRCQSAKRALARLQQQLPARPLPREVGQHERHVLVGIRLLTLAIQKALQQHCAVTAERTAESAPSNTAHILSTLRSSHADAMPPATSCNMGCRVHT